MAMDVETSVNPMMMNVLSLSTVGLWISSTTQPPSKVSPDGVFRVGGVGELLAEVVTIAAGHVRLVLAIHGHSQQGQGQYLGRTV